MGLIGFLVLVIAIVVAIYIARRMGIIGHGDTKQCHSSMTAIFTFDKEAKKLTEPYIYLAQTSKAKKFGLPGGGREGKSYCDTTAKTEFAEEMGYQMPHLDNVVTVEFTASDGKKRIMYIGHTHDELHTGDPQEYRKSIKDADKLGEDHDRKEIKFNPGEVKRAVLVKWSDLKKVLNDEKQKWYIDGNVRFRLRNVTMQQFRDKETIKMINKYLEGLKTKPFTEPRNDHKIYPSTINKG